MFLAFIAGISFSSPAPISLAMPSRVFVRGELVVFQHAGSTGASVSGTSLQAAVNNGVINLNTAALRPGSYTLDVQGSVPAKLPFTIGPKPDPNRFPVWKWGGTAPRSFAYYRERGFTGAGSPMISSVPNGDDKVVRDIKLSLDEAAKQGIDYGLYLNPLYDSKWKDDPTVLSERYDGQKMTQPYPRNSKVVNDARSIATRTAELFAEYPAWKHVLLGSEFQLDYNFGSEGATLARTEANVDVRTAGIYRQPKENMPVNGVIEDANPRYKFLSWWYHRGMGDAALNEAMSSILRSRRPDVLTWHDPYRLAPVSGAAKGLGAVSTWTYAHPDMTRLYYTRVLQAVARLDRQKAMQTITLFTYPRFVESVASDAGSLESDRPGGSRYFTAGPDFAKEALWLVFSQRPDIIGIYFGGALQPDDPNVDQNRASPATFDAIGGVVKTLVAPYGPTVLAARPIRPKVAVLMSASAIWLGESPKNVGYPTEQILPYTSLLAMNQVPFDVVLDEDVVTGRLSGYDVLVMPQGGALTTSMASQLRQFTGRGGKVIADQSLKASIGSVTVTNYDFTFQTRVDGVSLSKGEGITADENRRRMEAYAADLGKRLNVERYAWADSPRALVNAVDAGDLKLVFAVNDQREFGPRFGGAKLHLERGVGLSVRLTIPAKGAIYDAMTGQLVKTPISTTLPAAEGKLFAVLPEGSPVVAVAAPKSFIPGTPSPFTGTVRFPSGKAPRGAYPLQVTLTDPTGVNAEFTTSVAAKDGAFSVHFVPAVNDPTGTWTIRVTDLITRKDVTATFTR